MSKLEMTSPDKYGNSYCVKCLSNGIKSMNDDHINHGDKQETYIVVRDIVGPVPYWVIDESLPKSKARFKRLTGKFPSKNATMLAFTGKTEHLENIQVNDMGDILYHKSLTKAVLQ